MEELIQTLNQIEAEFERKKKELKNLRKAFVIAILFCSIYLIIRTVNLHTKYEFPQNELYLMILGIICLFMAPVIFSPLFTFFNSRLHNQINWNVKMGIFENAFKDHQIDFKVSFSNTLSSKDIDDLQLENSIFSFVYGDDLIFGDQNFYKFRIAEMHSTLVVKRKFDGLIGVKIFASDEECIKNFNTINENKIKNLKIIQKNNKIYYIMKGSKKYFEFSFKGGRLNKTKLILDFKELKTLVDIMFTEKPATNSGFAQRGHL
jgi:hypothetical protein